MAQLLDLQCAGDAVFEGARIDVTTGGYYKNGYAVYSAHELFPVGTVMITEEGTAQPSSWPGSWSQKTGETLAGRSVTIWIRYA